MSQMNARMALGQAGREGGGARSLAIAHVEAGGGAERC